MRTFLLTAIGCCIAISAFAQKQDSLLRRKMAPHLRQEHLQKTDNQINTYWITSTDPGSLKAFLQTCPWPVAITGEYAATGLIIVRTTAQCLKNNILPLAQVVFADAPRIPHEELIIKNFDDGVNQLAAVRNAYPLLNGQGLTVSVKENKPDTTDIDLTGRYLSTSLSSANTTTHAGIMSTIIIGAGNSDLTSRGVAPAASMTSSDFATLLPDPNSAYQQYSITVQNHSYGTGIENYYGADAAAYDASVITAPALLHVFSAGNAGNLTSTDGLYKNIPQTANITGSFKMGKNMLTTGAISRTLIPESLSSRGPAYDGRLKPELVAFGEDGSSGAAAIVSGIALVLQQAIQKKTGQLPPASLVRALLMNTADDIAAPGIDFTTGYGNVNAYKAVKAVEENKFYTGELLNGNSRIIPLAIPAGLSRIKIMLCWSDAPASANATKALINDLDLSVVNNTTGEAWKPWVLSHFPHKDSLSLAPARRTDTLNTQEQVTIDHPDAGNYEIRISASPISSAAQQFAICWETDTANQFTWLYPGKSDAVEAAQTSYLRWNATYPSGSTGHLWWSADNGQHWTSLSTAADLSEGWFSWTPPDTLTSLLFKMETGSSLYTSDTSILSPRLKAITGLHCTDSFLLSWNKPADVDSVRLFYLGDRYLQPLLTTRDTTIVLQKNNSPSLYYAVAPIRNNHTGIRSYTFNYTTQGVACYFKSFLADLADNQTISLFMETGTAYHIGSISFEKQTANGFTSLYTTPPGNTLSYQYSDSHVQQGANTYRVKILLTDGTILYSQLQTVYALGKQEYILFPNPVKAGTSLQLLSTHTMDATLFLYTAAGRQVIAQPITQWPQTVHVHSLPAGIYLYEIRQSADRRQTGKLVIY